jgi:hypothetical protein
MRGALDAGGRWLGWPNQSTMSRLAIPLEALSAPCRPKLSQNNIKQPTALVLRNIKSTKARVPAASLTLPYLRIFVLFGGKCSTHARLVVPTKISQLTSFLLPVPLIFSIGSLTGLLAKPSYDFRAGTCRLTRLGPRTLAIAWRKCASFVVSRQMHGILCMRTRFPWPTTHGGPALRPALKLEDD